MNNWIVKASYAHGSHMVSDMNGPLRFKSRQEALDRAETLNAQERKSAANNNRTSNTTFIVVEEQ